MTDTAVVERKPGTWAVGTSGNPKGRPKDQRDIVTLKNDLELAVREQLNPRKVAGVVNRLLKIIDNKTSKDKDVIAASKVILDMAISKTDTREPVRRGGFNIIIENATLVQNAAHSTSDLPAIEAEIVNG